MRDPSPRLLRVLEEDAALAPLAHALGADGLARARHATALVEGCGAVGAETARLLLASGLRRLVLVDLPHALGRVVTRDDLAANALLAEADVGVARVDALARRLAEALAADLGGGEALAADLGGGASDAFVASASASASVAAPPPLIVASRESAARCVADAATRGERFDVIVTAWHWDDDDDPSTRRGADDASAAFDSAVVNAHATLPSGSPRVFACAPGALALARVSLPPGFTIDDARTARSPNAALIESRARIDSGGDETRSDDAWLVTTAEASAHGFREDDRIGIGPGPTDEGSPAFVVREVRGPHAFVATRADGGGGGACDREGAATRPEEDAFAFASEGEYAFQRRRRRVATVADESFFDGGMRGLGIDASDAGAAVFDAGEVVAALARARTDGEGNAEIDDEKAAFTRRVVRRARVEFPPSCAVAGAVAASEALKIISSRFEPRGFDGVTSPWFAHDALAGGGGGGDDDDGDDAPALRREPLPGANSTDDEKTKADEKNARAPSWSVFGGEVDAEMRGMRFVVAGADGVAREVARQLATVGARARIHDGDSSDGRAGEDAARRANRIFSSRRFFREDEKKDVCPTTTTTHNAFDASRDAFPGGEDAANLDAAFVCVDGLETRRAWDRLAVRRRFAMLDVGVDGDTASVFVAAPGARLPGAPGAKTDSSSPSFGATAPWSHGPRDAPDREFPSCVLGNFPHVFAHCAKWARDAHEDLFAKRPAAANAYLRGEGNVSRLFRAFANAKPRAGGKNAGSSSDDPVERLREALGCSAKKGTEKGALALDVNVGSLLAEAEMVHEALVGARPRSVRACAAWALDAHDEYFARAPARTLAAFPLDRADERGGRFWNGITKRAPRAVAFDADDPARLTFVVAGGMLRARAYGLSGDVAEFAREARGAAAERNGDGPAAESTGGGTTPESTGGTAPSSAAPPKNDGDAASDDPTDLADLRRLAALLETLPARETLAGFRLTPTTFAPRAATTAAFVAAAAACRAATFGVPPPEPADLVSVAADARAGLPATAALAAALAVIEAYALAARRVAARSVAAEKAAETAEGGGSAGESGSAAAFISSLAPPPRRAAAGRWPPPPRHSFVGLGANVFASSDALPARVRVARTAATHEDIAWTAWDTLELECDARVTLREFVQLYEARFGLAVSAVSRGPSLVYADFMNPAKLAQRLAAPLVDVLREFSRGDDGEEAIPGDEGGRVRLAVGACDENDDDVDAPDVEVRLVVGQKKSTGS